MPSFLIMGGAAASETLKGGYICTIGGCSTPQKQPRENPASGSPGAGSLDHKEQLVASQNSLCSHSRH